MQRRQVAGPGLN